MVMENFIAATRQAIQQQNWHATLMLALTLPDICSRYAYPTITGSQERYITWFDQYLLKSYVHPVGPDRQAITFLSGRDCYALRCSLLHEGGSDITQQRAREVLDNFYFLIPPPVARVHLNRISGTKLQLQIDIFGEEVASACDEWWASLDERDRENINQDMLRVQSISPFSP